MGIHIDRQRVLLVLDDGSTATAQKVASRNWAPVFSALHRRGVEYGLVVLRDGTYMVPAAPKTIESLALGARNLSTVDPRPLRRFIHGGGYDVVHSHEIRPALLTSVASMGLRRRPARIFHRHHGVAYGRLAAAGWLASVSADLTVTVSHSAAAYARSDHVPGSRLRVVHNGVPPERDVSPSEIQNVRKELGVSPTSSLVVYVGRLRREKNVPLLVHSIPIVRRLLDRDVRLVIVGDGPETSSLRELSEKVEGVHVLGHKDDVAPWFAAADIVASSSHNDACPLSLLQAMSMGKAIVASKRDGIVELLEDGVSGLLVDPLEPSAFARGLCAVLADAGVRSRLEAGSRARFESSFSLDKMVDGWLEAYRELAEIRRRVSR